MDKEPIRVGKWPDQSGNPNPMKTTQTRDYIDIIPSEVTNYVTGETTLGSGLRDLTEEKAYNNKKQSNKWS